MNVPLTREKVEGQLSRTGGTPFSCEKVTVHVDEGLSLPLSALNALRRQALEELGRQRTALPERRCEPFHPGVRYENRKQPPVYTLSVRAAEQVSPELLRLAPALLYLPAGGGGGPPGGGGAGPEGRGAGGRPAAPHLHATGRHPPSARSWNGCGQLGVTDALAGTLDSARRAAELGFTLRGDYGLGVYNGQTLKELKRLGFRSATASFELKLAQIRDLSKALDTELIVYGRLPLMITENCIIHNHTGRHTCANVNLLTDRKGERFPVVKAPGCRNEILNSKKLFLADKAARLRQRLGLWAGAADVHHRERPGVRPGAGALPGPGQLSAQRVHPGPVLPGGRIKRGTRRGGPPMFSRQRLFWHRGPYDLPSTDQLFLQATADCCAFHMARCPQYRAIAEHLGFSPDQLRTMDDLVRVPMLPTLFFKRHALFSMPRRRMVMKVTSSGTSGTFSQVGFDLGCIWAEVPMVLRLGWRHRLISFRPANYVVLGYKPDRRSSAGVTRTMFGMTFFAPPLRRFYALRWQGEGYVPDLDGAVEALERFSRSPFPTRIVGFPSYLWFGLKRMEELGISLRLRPGSKILLAGGWKQHWQQQVDKSVLYSLVRRVLGVGEEDIHELFGAVEHPIFYNTCPRHHFHVPIYSRVLIRDPATLEPLPMGQVGLVNLISPLIRATPVTSVVTDDLGYLTPGDACGCGLTSPYLTLLGRVGLGDIKTCAAGAADLLGKGEGF